MIDIEWAPTGYEESCIPTFIVLLNLIFKSCEQVLPILFYK